MKSNNALIISLCEIWLWWIELTIRLAWTPPTIDDTFGMLSLLSTACIVPWSLFRDTFHMYTASTWRIINHVRTVKSDLIVGEFSSLSKGGLVCDASKVPKISQVSDENEEERPLCIVAC